MNVLRLVALSLLSASAVACAPAPAAPPPVSSNTVATSAPAPAPRPARIYRLDFVLNATDGNGGAPTATSFTMNLVDHDAGEVTVGKNVPLNPTSSPAPSPRRDVGLKVKTALKDVGEDVYLETSFEMSSFEANSTIRKIVERSDALVVVGKPSLITSLDDDKKHYDLSVTPTKLR